MEANTCWVANDHGWLNIYEEPPTWRGEDWSDNTAFLVRRYLYWTLGLPSEPAPGSCWRVEWRNLDVVTCEEVGRERVRNLPVPIARDVTEELKAVRRD